MPLTVNDLQALLVLNQAGSGVCSSLMEILKDCAPSVLLKRILEENFMDRAQGVKEALKIFDPCRELEACGRSGIEVLTFWDEDYPEILRQIFDPPAVLYVAGRILKEDSAAVAIVGSRHASLYGACQSRKIASGLAESGITVVSGMAQGIDLSAHEGALSVSHGRTLAILGCGLHTDYPRHRKKIQEKICERGAVLSEYSLTMPPLPENFPKRNRLISGLSLGVLVVEAHQKSGSLITAQLALDQGRDVFALPGSVDAMNSKGTHQLIKQGAYLAENAQDILEVLKLDLDWVSLRDQNPENILERNSLENRSLEEMKILQSLKAGPRTREEVMDTLSCHSPGQGAVLLTSLELKRVIRRRLDGRYELLSSASGTLL